MAAGWALAALAACAALPGDGLNEALGALMPTQVLLLGEQHDAPAHQELHRRAVDLLAARGQLAALVLEMAPSGTSTVGLPALAEEGAVRQALGWDERAWSWQAYGPAVMAAVRAGVPVLGGNLPRESLRASMGQAELDQRLPADALARQQGLIREGHCRLLPESQIAPMTRAQIARDVRMAQTLASALPLARPGQALVLISGSAHADRQLGVPVHLPADVKSASLRLQAGPALPGERFDRVLLTPAAPATDHCAGLAEQFQRKERPASR
jgi:uncharacterized iron-regulated protein